MNRNIFGACALVSCCLFLNQARAEQLQYFKNYFVTGDYNVAGVGLRGTGGNGYANGTVRMTGVPSGADIVAAYLYWSTEERGSTPIAINAFFRGEPIVGLPIGDDSNPACWSSGGTSGPKDAFARTYRTDVLRYLPIDSNLNVRVANGDHSFRVPNNTRPGNGNVPSVNGAALLVIYRIVTPGMPRVEPLRSVVIYDGAFSVDKHSASLSQTIGGFYQALGTPAKLTHLVANGQPGDSTSVRVNGQPLTNSSNSFRGALGGRWDNPTFTFTPAANASSFTAQVSTTDNQTCLSWSAIVTSMAVKDTDYDGLLDVWEEKGLNLDPGSLTIAPKFGTCLEFPYSCLNLPAMGALKNVPDLFTEIDWMIDAGHEHKPKKDALVLVADAFRKGAGIRVHWDVGNNYQDLANPTNNFIVVPNAFAQGGQLIQESLLACPNPLIPDQTAEDCAFPNLPYSVLGWKVGFRAIKEGFPALQIPAHFARDRKDSHHYVLFGHALGIPTEPPSGEPKSVSGVADRPGGDAGVFMGLWRSDIAENDMTGSVTAQAGTLMHEVGHNLGLSHAGIFRSPNCQPNYRSIMNYGYQTRGLSTIDGVLHIDFSDGSLGSLDENNLAESAVPPGYLIRYYGPYRSGIDPPDAAAKLHCDGTPIEPWETPMIRLENTFNFLDWDHDGRQNASPLRLDVNFSGVIGDPVGAGNVFLDSNDWANLNLQQVGARLNVNGLSVDVGQTDLGQTDLGQTDLGQTDLGQTDLGQTDLGQTDLGQTDLGQTDLGDIDYETVVLATIDPPATFDLTVLIDRIRLTFAAPQTGGIAEYRIYRASNGGPFTEFRRIAGGQSSIVVDDIPSVGGTTDFNIAYSYRVTSVVNVQGALNESAPTSILSGTVKRLFVAGLNLSRPYRSENPAVLLSVTGLDLPLPPGATCITTATVTSWVGEYPILCGGPATTPNPVNGIDYVNGTLTITPVPASVTPNAANKTYGDPDPSFSGTLAGFFAEDGVSAAYSRTAGESVTGGPYSISATLSPVPVLVNYVVTYNTAAFTILPRPISVSADAKTKLYGDPDPPLTFQVANGNLVGSDSFTGALTRAAGAVPGAYAIQQGSLTAGSNYALTFSGAALTILPRPITVTADTLTKYVGTADPPLTYQVTSGSLAPGDSFTGGLTRTLGEAVGSYPILQGTLTAGPYYVLTYAGATLSIQPPPLYFRATNVMSERRSGHTATLLPNGKVLVTGGTGLNGLPLASAEVFDPATETWSLTANILSTKAAGHTATLLPDGRVLIAGGVTANSEIYDPATNTFGPRFGNMQRVSHTATLLPNGKVLLAGGTSTTGDPLKTAQLFDPLSGTYVNTGDLTIPRDFHTATLLTDGPHAGKVLIAGGRTGARRSLVTSANAELYDPATGTFSAIASSMSDARYGHSVTALNGKLHFIAGANTSVLTSTDVFDPVTMTFSRGSVLAAARLGLATTSIFGYAVVTGGSDGNQIFASAEASAGSTFYAIGNMTQPHKNHSLTPITLSSGPAVLVTGGLGGDATATNVSEILYQQTAP